MKRTERVRGYYLFFLSFVSFYLLLISSVFAIQLNSRTYLKLAETYQGDKTAPVFEYLDFHSPVSFKNYDLGLDIGLWVKADPLGNDPDRNTDQELQYAYFTLNDPESRYTLKAGRVPLLEGIVNETIDGLYGSVHLMDNFKTALYVGSPVSLDIDDRGGDLAYGAGLWYYHPKITVGLSFIDEQNDSNTFRQALGLNLLAVPVDKLTIYERTIYNVDTSGFGSHEVTFSYGPMKDKYNLEFEFAMYDYEHFFSGTTNPVFAQRTGAINSQESMTSFGGNFEVKLTEALSLRAIYKHYTYDISDSANQYGIDVVYKPDEGDYSVQPDKTIGASLTRISGGTDAQKYTELRVYGYSTYKGYKLSLDLLVAKYDQDRNGQDLELEGSVAVEHSLKENLNIGADLTYESNPEFDSRLTGFLKLIYVFNG